MTREVPQAKEGRISLWRVTGWSIAALLLLLPLAAMQVTREVNWTASDFVFAAVLIGGAGLALEWVARTRHGGANRGAIALLVAAAFLLVWINAAVGIIGREDNPLNLLYGGVLAVIGVGAVASGLRPGGMARAAAAAAVAQALVGVIGVFAAGDQPPGAIGLVLLNGGFVALFAGAAWLFRVAARESALDVSAAG